MTQPEFEALSLEEKLLWLYRETEAGKGFDNRLSERIAMTAGLLATVTARVEKLEKGK
jgi:hypothetical protein